MKRFGIFIAVFMLLIQVSPVMADKSEITLDDLSILPGENFNNFEVKNFDGTVLTVSYDGVEQNLVGDASTVVYIALDLRNQSWMKVLLFTPEFFEYAKGKEYSAAIDVGSDNPSGKYQTCLVLVPVEIMPKILDGTEVHYWNQEYSTLGVWLYPVNRFMVIQNDFFEEAVVIHNLHYYDNVKRIAVGPASVVTGYINVETDPFYGYSLKITENPVDQGKAKWALWLWKLINPKSISVYTPSDACWNFANNTNSGWLERWLCGTYYVPDK